MREIPKQSTLNERYEVGKTQNRPENILLFLQQNALDPAIRVRL